MVLFIRIEKDNEIKEEKLENIQDLYKKCGLRKSDGFEMIHSKYIKELDLDLILWGRQTGRANIKSSFLYKYDDKIISIYGTCAFIAEKNNKLVDLSLENWNSISNTNEKIINNKEPNEKINVIDKNNQKKSDYNSDSESVSDLSELTDESNDSELKIEEYIYSSEDEI